MAHDLGNPLTTVKGQAQLLRRRARQGRADLATLETGLGAIEGATDRATRLIAELTDAARLEAQRPLDLRRTAIDLVALAEASIAESQAAAAGHPLHLETGVAEVVGLWDADRLTRVLENLVANAVKYSPAGSPVVVRVDREDAPAVRSPCSPSRIKVLASRPTTYRISSSASGAVATWPVALPAAGSGCGEASASWRSTVA